MSLLTRVSVKRTIWPYDDGWGVVLTRPLKTDTVLAHGLSKAHAKAYANTVKQELK